MPRRFIGGVTARFTEWNRPIATCNQIGEKSPQPSISRFGTGCQPNDAADPRHSINQLPAVGLSTPYDRFSADMNGIASSKKTGRENPAPFTSIIRHIYYQAHLLSGRRNQLIFQPVPIVQWSVSPCPPAFCQASCWLAWVPNTPQTKSLPSALSKPTEINSRSSVGPPRK